MFLAGCIAQKMGLPIQLVAAVNSNDIIHRTVKDGDFSLSGCVKATLASAMDIQVDNELEQMEDNELAYFGIFFFLVLCYTWFIRL